MNIKKRNQRKGFTLIELLVVIAIIAVLAVVVILSLNPAELLRQARDSNRISDLATLKSAISLYLADVSSPNLASTTAGYIGIYTSYPTSTTVTPSTTWGIVSYSISRPTTTIPTRAIDASGWIPVNFNAISSGAPLGSLPADPNNSTTSFYAYVATSSNLSFKVTTHMESSKYGTGGGADVQTPDGGISTSTYEQGTNLGL